MQQFLFKKIHLKNVTCKIVAILFRSQYANTPILWVQPLGKMGPLYIKQRCDTHYQPMAALSADLFSIHLMNYANLG